jgi:hypothetical protein
VLRGDVVTGDFLTFVRNTSAGYITQGVFRSHVIGPTHDEMYIMNNVEHLEAPRC